MNKGKNHAFTVPDVSKSKATYTLASLRIGPNTTACSFLDRPKGNFTFYSHVYIRLQSSFPICSLSYLLFPVLSLLSVLPFLLYLLLFNPFPSVCFSSFHVSFLFNCTIPLSLLVSFLGDFSALVSAFYSRLYVFPSAFFFLNSHLKARPSNISFSMK
jgi:hypothetical protein